MDRPLTQDRQTGKLKSNLQREMCLALVSHELRTPTNATAADGLGLGLAIARHIIESHKGKINAESLGEGKGTKLTITLPLLDEIASDKRTP
jgi:signal transduction histidine kinase